MPYNLPMMGVGLDPFPHDETLVRVVDKRPMLRKKRFNLVTPFAGKAYCFRQYLRGIRRLPLKDAHPVFYDNSNSPAFRNRLTGLLKEFDSYTLIEDTNPHFTVETTQDYARICNRCHSIYETLYATSINRRLPLSLNVEDDVEVPANAWGELSRTLDDYRGVGSVAGSCRSRRMNDDTACYPIAFNFERREQVGGDRRVRAVDSRLTEEKPFGVEPVGATHFGCTLFRTNVVRDVGMPMGTDGVRGVDLCFGYSSNLAGYGVAMNWDVKTKHYFKANGKVQYV
jgi:hypothetical protein